MDDFLEMGSEQLELALLARFEPTSSARDAAFVSREIKATGVAIA